MPLEIEVHIEPGDRKRIALTGSLNTDTAPQLQDKLDQEIDSDVRIVVFDLKNLEYLSSAGLRVVFKTRNTMDARQGKFMLLNLQPQVHKVFEIIKVLDIMDVFSSQAELDDYLIAMQSKIMNDDS